MHIPAEHLLAVACADDLVLTQEELDHMDECSECLEKWQECIEESERRLEDQS
jgi:hypothetical protein